MAQTPTNFAGSGYLSSSYAPFSLGSDPANPGFRVQDLALPGGVTPDRFTTRRNMLDAVNAHFARIEQVKRFAVAERDLSQEHGELTPTMKVKRALVNSEYSDLFDSLYT